MKGKRDKEERRQRVRADFRVVMLVGDTLSDFASDFEPAKADAGDPKALLDAINDRNAKVEKTHRGKWGAEWIVLPNPSYGEWTRMAGSDPLKVMNPTTLKP
jgi:predicted secreted acid phosphatase